MGYCGPHCSYLLGDPRGHHPGLLSISKVFPVVSTIDVNVRAQRNENTNRWDLEHPTPAEGSDKPGNILTLPCNVRLDPHNRGTTLGHLSKLRIVLIIPHNLRKTIRTTRTIHNHLCKLRIVLTIPRNLTKISHTTRASPYQQTKLENFLTVLHNLSKIRRISSSRQQRTSLDKHNVT